jgi:CHAT domain-containing protein
LRLHGRAPAAGLAPLLLVALGAPHVSCRSARPAVRADDARWLELRLGSSGRADVCSPILAAPPAVKCAAVLTPDEAERAFRQWPGSPTRLALVRESIAGGERMELDAFQADADQRGAESWNEIGVAFALKAERERRYAPYFRAVEAFAAALRADPAHLPSRFNRGLVLARLGLAEEARREWTRYLALETDEAWKKEVHVRLRDMPPATPATTAAPAAGAGPPSAEAVASDPEGAVEAWRRSLRPLAAAGGWDDFCAPHTRDAWAAVGRALEQRFDDAFVGAAQQWLLSRCAAGAAARAATSATLGALLDGLDAVDASRNREAERLLGKAERELDAAGSPLAAWASVRLGGAYLGADLYPAARAQFERVQPTLERRRFRSQLARARWGWGTVALRSGHTGEAVRRYSQAVDAVSTGGAPVMAAVLRSLVADALSVAGDFERAWSEGVRALHDVRGRGGRDRVSSVCNQLAAVSANAEDWPASLLYQECAVEAVDAFADPTYTSDALVWRALCHHRLGSSAAALRDLEEAAAVGAHIGDDAERRRALAAVDLVAGFLLGRSSPGEAQVRLARAARFFAGIGNDVNRFLAGVGALDAALAAGDLGDADRRLATLEALQSRLARRTGSDALSLTLLGRGAALADRRVRFELQRQDVAAAAAASDGGRIRDGDARVTARDLQDLARRLPPDTAVVAFSWLEGEVRAFALRPGRPLSSWPAAARLSAGLVAALATPVTAPGNESWEQASARVYRALLGPGAHAIEGATHLVFVPDGPLFSLPMAMLRDEGGRPLITRAAISIAPDLRSLVRARGAALPTAPRAVAALADPVTAAVEGPLPSLPGARAEAETVAQLVPGGKVRLFTGAQATAAHFLHSLDHADVVHFGGHAVLDAREPLRSRLLFSPDATHPGGRLEAAELYGLRPVRARLVVLASCGSAASPAALPQSLSVVRPLLEAGVDEVVGSIGVLPDAQTAQLMTAFYARLGQGATPAAALRGAQLAALQGAPRGSIPAWAFVQVYGYRPAAPAAREGRFEQHPARLVRRAHLDGAQQEVRRSPARLLLAGRAARPAPDAASDGGHQAADRAPRGLRGGSRRGRDRPVERQGAGAGLRVA